MTKKHSDEDMTIDEINQMIFSAIGLPLARMIQNGEISPETVSRDELATKLKGLDHDIDDAFEIHLTHIDKEMLLVAHCN